MTAQPEPRLFAWPLTFVLVSPTFTLAARSVIELEPPGVVDEPPLPLLEPVLEPEPLLVLPPLFVLLEPALLESFVD